MNLLFCSVPRLVYKMAKTNLEAELELRKAGRLSPALHFFPIG